MSTALPNLLLSTVFGFLLMACGQQESSSGQKPSPPPAAPAEPPPSYAIQAERALLEELGAQSTEKGLRVLLSGVKFRAGQSDLDLAATARLDKVAELMRLRPSLQARIVGYTDSRGSESANKRVSLERAQAVREILVKRGRIDAGRVVSDGKGEADPIATNDTEEGRQTNRRVELLLLDPKNRLESSDSP